jgi:predicted  nucleic acid-binding Zn-ribbon protein
MSTKTTKNQVKSTNNFVTKALASLNKSEAQKQEEQVTLFVKRSIIEVQQQISLRKSNISNLELDLQAANSKLEMAQEAFEAARFTPATNLESYLSTRNSAQYQVDKCTDEVSLVNEEIEELNAEITALEAVLADFQ